MRAVRLIAYAGIKENWPGQFINPNLPGPVKTISKNNDAQRHYFPFSFETGTFKLLR